MIGLIQWLENLSHKDTKVRAVLRRSLSFDPGTCISAYPYVEWSLRENATAWNRSVHYLVAALWAQNLREQSSESDMLTLAQAVANLDSDKREGLSGEDRLKISSTEKRFINLLDADSDQLPYRLRQMIALLKGDAIDFEALRNDLLFWNDDQKRVQNRWARQYYHNLFTGSDDERHVAEETVT